MQLAELFRRARVTLPEGRAALGPGAETVEVAAVTADSRAVTVGTLFAALPGSTTDGRRFIPDAVASGASAVLAPNGTEWPRDVPPVPLILADEPRAVLARLAAALAPSWPGTVVAVTGTNGKTSTAEFCRQLWALLGKRAASLGTLGVRAPDDVALPVGPALTTPDPVGLARTLAVLAGGGVDRVAMEASSHGLAQGRLDGVEPRVAAFTNLTRDHLDYHGTETGYRAAKLRLFSELLPRGGAAVVNADADGETLRAIEAIAEARALRLHTVGVAGRCIRLIEIRPTPNGLRVAVEAEDATREIALPLVGRYQAENALLAAAIVATAEARPVNTVLDRLEHVTGVRGRLERAAVLPNGSIAYVDYAHTPDGLDTVLASLRQHAPGRIVLVFGAGGDRDAGKRPLMGQAARRGADHLIVTDDNPRSEAPDAIRAAILAGCPSAAEVGDRTDAIRAGLAELGPDDVLLVAGKGHETGQAVGDRILPFDDVEVIRRLAAGAPA